MSSVAVRLPAVLLVTLSYGALSGGQAPAADAPEVSAHEAPITFSSRVNLISVPVVVRDREGRAIGNLQKEDFQVFDKGKPQIITKFSIEKSSSLVEVKPGPSSGPRATTPAPISSPPVLPERYVAYLVDDVHLDSGDLLNTRQAMHRHLNESLEPTSRAAILTTSGITLANFTADRDEAARRSEQTSALYQRHRSANGLSVYQLLHGRSVCKPESCIWMDVYSRTSSCMELLRAAPSRP